MEVRLWVDVRCELLDYMRCFIWFVFDYNEKWFDFDDWYRRKLCYLGNWKVIEMWLKSDCIVIEFWLNFDWNVFECYWKGIILVIFLEFLIICCRMYCKKFYFVDDIVLIFYFFWCIFVSRGRVEIDVYLLFFYCIGSNIMIVSILGRRFGYYMYIYYNCKICVCCFCYYFFN